MARLSSYFLPTLRDDPADAEALSNKLMVRVGLIRQVGAGCGRSCQPLPGGQAGRGDHPEEIDGIGGQES
jgi:prolyl-tRNA synthetase